MTENEIKLRRAWIAQLRHEHRSICWQYNTPLKMPGFEILETKGQWGRWDSQYKTISVSSHLILAYSWDTVVNVLKHEMAHQAVSEVFHGTSGHDDKFRHFCRRFGLPRPYWTRSGDLGQAIAADARAGLDEELSSEESGQQKILERVRKLLALAQSSNEHEAFLAMKKVNELIEKYNLERIEHAEDFKTSYTYRIINPGKKRIENYQRSICGILRDYYFVDIVYSRLYDASACETCRTIEILGTRENVVIAEYVYDFLMTQLEILWNVHQRETDSPGRNKRSYWLGLLKGFKEKLEKMERERHPKPNAGLRRYETTSALVCADDVKLKNFTSLRFPRLRTFHPKGAHIDPDTYAAGVAEGRLITIHKGISETGQYNGKLLA